MLRALFLVVAFFGFICAPPAEAQFVGKLVLKPKGCQAKGNCRIGAPFRFTDRSGLTWYTAPPDKTDGASIPFWAQPFIGKPFDRSYIKAAVIHDHYCERQVHEWQKTHRVFYEALRAAGVPDGKAKLMYYAVYLGGPKWLGLMPPKTCPGATPSQPCIYLDGEQRDTAITIKATRPAQYDRPGFNSDLKEAEQAINASGGAMTLDELDKRAQEKRPDDFFYKNGKKAEVVDTAPLP